MRNAKVAHLEHPTSPSTGPTLFEAEFLRQLQRELKIFMDGKQFPTMQGIVLGIQGANYQAIIPIASGK